MSPRRAPSPVDVATQRITDFLDSVLGDTKRLNAGQALDVLSNVADHLEASKEAIEEDIRRDGGT